MYKYNFSAQKLVRNHPGRKSLKDIFRSSIKLENGFSKISSSDKKEKEFLHEKIQKSEKEIESTIHFKRHLEADKVANSEFITVSIFNKDILVTLK